MNAITNALISIPRILWIDDDFETIERYKETLENQQDSLGIEIEIVASLEDARSKLASGDYAAAVFDCKMDRYDEGINGAELLVEVNQRWKDLPTFVYSAFLDDPLYEGLLKKSLALKQMSKLEDFTKPISKDLFFVTIANAAHRYDSARNMHPERIEYFKYMKRPAAFAKEVDTHWLKFGNWIKAEMARSGNSWCVVCGDRIVAGSQNPFDFPSDLDLERIGEENNLIPFAYSEDLLPEDSSGGGQAGIPWNSTKYPDDAYPTIKVKLDGRLFVDDFDTGAIRTHVSDEVVDRGALNFWQDSGASHLGYSYKHFSKRVEVALIASNGAEASNYMTVTVVHGWSKSPFVQVNKKRLCLFGRDLLHTFCAEIQLNSQTRTTYIRLL